MFDLDKYKSAVKGLFEDIGNCSVRRIRMESIRQSEDMSVVFLFYFTYMERFKFEVNQTITESDHIRSQRYEDVGIRLAFTERFIYESYDECRNLDFNGRFFTYHIYPRLRAQIEEIFHTNNYIAPPKPKRKPNIKIRRIRL